MDLQTEALRAMIDALIPVGSGWEGARPLRPEDFAPTPTAPARFVRPGSRLPPTPHPWGRE